MKRQGEFLQVCLALLLVVSLVDCRPRGNRTKTTPPADQKTNAAAQPTPQAVLARTDSAIERVASLNNGDDEKPPVATDETLNRTPWGSTYTPTPGGGDYDVYQSALGSYNAGQYDQAIASFSKVAISGKPPELVPNSYYWMGESYYAMQRFADCLPYFEYVTKAGPEYKRQMAFYKLALANDNLGNRQAANMWYERLRNDYPSSSYAKLLSNRGLR